MTPIYQRPGDGKCFSACVASLLDLPLDSVPRFYSDLDPRKPVEATANEVGEMARWFAKRDLYYVEFGFQITLIGVAQGMATFNPGLHYILAGCNVRGGGHAMVARDARIMHDPAGPRPPSGYPFLLPFPDNSYRVGIIAKNLT